MKNKIDRKKIDGSIVWNYRFFILVYSYFHAFVLSDVFFCADQVRATGGIPSTLRCPYRRRRRHRLFSGLLVEEAQRHRSRGALSFIAKQDHELGDGVVESGRFSFGSPFSSPCTKTMKQLNSIGWISIGSFVVIKSSYVRDLNQEMRQSTKDLRPISSSSFDQLEFH